jgi:hypothetical protein
MELKLALADLDAELGKRERWFASVDCRGPEIVPFH